MNKDVEKITTATTVTSRNRNKWKHSYENHLSSKSLCVLLHFCCCCCFMSSFMRWMNVASERAKTHFGPLNIPLHTFAVPDDVWVVWESPHTGIYFILNGLFFSHLWFDDCTLAVVEYAITGTRTSFRRRWQHPHAILAFMSCTIFICVIWVQFSCSVREQYFIFAWSTSTSMLAFDFCYSMRNIHYLIWTRRNWKNK